MYLSGCFFVTYILGSRYMEVVFFPGLSPGLLNFFLFDYLTRFDPRFYYRTPNPITSPRVPLPICVFHLLVYYYTKDDSSLFTFVLSLQLWSG